MVEPVIPLDERQRREWLKYQLGLRGYTLSKLAQEVGLSRHAAKQALHRPYPKMERIIAERLQLEPMQIWPERYDEQGRPSRRAGRPLTHGGKDNKAPSKANGNLGGRG